MNKYFYPIYKMKLKPWIKYWLLKKANHELPIKYKEIDYITSDGQSYINTLKGLGEQFKIKCIFKLNEKISQEQPVVSNWTVQYGYFNCFIHYNSNTLRCYIKGHNNIGELELNQFYELIIERLDMQHFKTTINNTITNIPANISENNPTPIRLFARGDNQPNSHVSIKLFEIYENEKLKMQLIPCYRKSDDVIGMYDLVEKKFFTNAGSGTFEKGGDI